MDPFIFDIVSWSWEFIHKRKKIITYNNVCKETLFISFQRRVAVPFIFQKSYALRNTAESCTVLPNLCGTLLYEERDLMLFNINTDRLKESENDHIFTTIYT